MIKELFQKSKKKKYATVPEERERQNVPEGIMTKCPKCKKIVYSKDLNKNLNVCVFCSYHHKMTAYERISSVLDEGTFHEYDGEMISVNPLNFPDYESKVEADRKKTNLNEAIVTGKGAINGMDVVIAVMESNFRMASMGSVVGENIARAVERARENKVPFIITDKKLKLIDGKLGDIAPSILWIMGLDIPSEMTGNILIKNRKKR